MKRLLPALAKRSLALALALALLLSLCPVIPIQVHAAGETASLYVNDQGKGVSNGIETLAASSGVKAYGTASTLKCYAYAIPAQGYGIFGLDSAFLADLDGNATIKVEYLADNGAIVKINTNYSLQYVDEAGNVQTATPTSEPVVGPDFSVEGAVKSWVAEYKLTDAGFNGTIDGKANAAFKIANTNTSTYHIGIRSITVTKDTTGNPGEGSGSGDETPVDSASVKVELDDGAANQVLENAVIKAINTSTGSSVAFSATVNGGYAYWGIPTGYALAISLSNNFLTGFSDGKATVTVEYYDYNQGSAELVYHSTSTETQRHATTITTDGSGTGELKTVTYPLTDAVLTKAYGLTGVSLAIASNGAAGSSVLIKSVTITKGAEIPVNYTAELNSAVTDLKFYDDAAMDLALSVKTDGADEAVNVTYTLTGGNLTEAETGSSDVTLTAAGVGILDAAWFNEKVTGYGDYTLAVVVKKADQTEVINKTFTFSRNRAYEMDLISAGGKTELVYVEDEAYDLAVKLQKLYGDAKDLTLEYSINGGTPVAQTVTVPAAEAANVALDLSALTDFGTYTLVCNLKDGDTLLVTETYSFARKMATPIISGLRSDNAENTTLTYKDDAAYDLKLYLQHRIPEAANFTVLYTICKDGVALEGLTDKTVDVTGLTETEQAFALELPATDLYGNFTLALTIKDGEGNAVHTKEFAFSRRMTNFANTSLSSAVANDGLVFADDTAYDLKLSVQKADGNDEELAISYVLVNTAAPSTVIKEGSFANQVYSGTTPTVLDLAEVLAGVTGFGTFELKLTITNTLGTVQEAIHTFSRVESFKVDLTSAGNAGANLVFPEDKAYDLQLTLVKQTGADVVYDVVYVVSQGETSYTFPSFDDVPITGTPTVLNLDMTGVDGNGSFAIVVSLVDAEGNPVKSYNFTVGRVPAMEVEFDAPGAVSASEDTVTYIDHVPYDITLNAKKQNGDPQDMTVKYVVTNKDGNEVVNDSKTVSIGSAAVVPVELDLEAVEGYGTYTLTATILDAYGNEAKTVSINVVREDTVQSALMSGSNPDLVYTENDGAFKMALYLRMYTDAAETLNVKYTVYAPDGTVITAFDKVITVPDKNSNPAQAPLTEALANYTDTFGTYKVELKVIDAADRVREDVVYNFYRIQSADSVKAEMGSVTNPDLIFTVQDVIDPILQLSKTDAEQIKEGFDILLTITDEAGNALVLTDKEGNKLTYLDADSNELNGLKTKLNPFVSVKVALADVLDFSKIITQLGTYKVNITLTDDSTDENNVRLVFSHEFKVVDFDTVKSQMGSVTNPDLIFTVQDVIDPILQLTKTDNIEEAFKIALTITDKDGNALTFTEKVNNTQVNKLEGDLGGFITRKITLADLIDFSSCITQLGTYNINVTLTDDAGKVRHTASHALTVVASDSVKSEMGSTTNPDLIFTVQDVIDPIVQLTKTDGIEEAFKIALTITDKDGNALTFTEKVNGTQVNKLEGELGGFVTRKIALADLIDFSSCITQLGTYNINVTLTDDAGKVRIEATHPLTVVAMDSVVSGITSESCPNLLFLPGTVTDLTLHLKKTDGVAEGFTALITVTDKDGKELKKLEGKLAPFTSTKASFADLEGFDLSSIVESGTYNVNVTLTDDAGKVRLKSSTPFTIRVLENSVDSAVTSAANGDMIFTEGEDFDLTLHLRKNDGIAEAFTAVITITDKSGKELKKVEVNVPARETLKVSVSDLIDLSDMPATGIFNLNLVLTDVAGNKRLDKTTAFCRVAKASVKTQISSNTNRDMIFTDKDTVDLNLYIQKTDGIDETLRVKYTVTSPSGAEIAVKEGNVKALSGSKYFKATLDELTGLSEHGIYKIHLVVTDNSGIVRSESVTQLARISGDGIKHQISSSSGKSLQFSANKAFDMCLFIQKTDGIKESFQGQVQVTDPFGNVIFSIKGKINVPATGYFKFPLDLSKGTAFGTYKATYTLHDDAGTLRASGTTYFSRVSDNAVRAAVQSASGKYPGLIYGKDDAFDLALYLQKTDGVEQMLQVRYTVTDMNSIVLETKQGRINVPATGYRKLPIELPDIEALQKFGIYNFKLEVANTEGKLIFSEDYSFSRVLTPEKQLDIMGVCTHLSKRGMSTKQSQMYVDLARQAGASLWRDELPWSTVEPAKGQYYFPASADAAVDYTLSIGLEPLFILDYGNSLYGSDVTTDEWLEGYLGYVEAMVTHFKGRIKYYEVWNEWNIGLGGMDKKYRDMTDVYAKLLVAAYKVIKEIDPEATVIGGVVAGGDEDWIEEMLKYPGVVDAMDAFSFHDYPDNDVREIQEQTEKVRELLTEAGRPDIDLWLTETGWPTHIGRNSFTEEVSAGNLVSMYTWAMANPDVLDKIFWYDLHNDGTEAEDIESNFGLLRNWDADEESVPMAAKKSYVAMNALNAILVDAEYVGLYDMGHKAISAYHFKKDGKDLLVVWADDVAMNMVATIGNNNMIVTDMYGNANALTPVNGKVTLFLSDAPIYIEYDLSNKLELVEGGFKLDQAKYSATPAATFPVQITRNNGLETFEGTYAFSMPEGWSVEGVEFGAAAAGATEITDTVYVTVGDDATKGETSISVRVISNSNVMGQFNIPIEMGDICTVNPDVVFTEDGHEFKLSVEVINEKSTKPLSGTIKLLSPAALIGGASSVPFEIPAGENKAVLIDIPAEMANTYHTVKVEVILESGAKHEVTKPISFLYAIEAPKDMKLDGVIDEQWADAMEFTAGEDDWENDNSSDADWPGNTAKGYAMWDNEYLYVAIEVEDASHYQDGTGASIWLGDSIQMATDVTRFTVPGYYGFNEIGFSMSTDGSTIENWNWYAAPGKNVSEGGIFKIVRDEEAGTTTYEAALPWNELLPNGAEFDLKTIGFSVVVNENSLDEEGDPTGRTGWIEYMSGVGRRKDPTLFGDLILAKRPTE